VNAAKLVVMESGPSKNISSSNAAAEKGFSILGNLMSIKFNRHLCCHGTELFDELEEGYFTPIS